MDWLVTVYLGLAFWARVVIIFFIIVIIFWILLVRKILFVLSVIPFLINKIFRLCYLIVELPISFLHRRFGTLFYKIDNGMSAVGKKIDSVLESWYHRWHSSKKKHLVAAGILYILLIFIVVIVPTFAKSQESPLKLGESLYMKGEFLCVKWLETNGWYNEPQQQIKSEEIYMQIGNKNILLNGELVIIDSEPLTISDKTYIPIRIVIEALGGSVEWDEKTQNIFLDINQKQLSLNTLSGETDLNGVKKRLINTPVEIEHCIYVSAREVLELLDFQVEWFENHQIINIYNHDIKLEMDENVVADISIKLK